MNHIGFYLRKVYSSKLSGQLIFKKGGVQKLMFFQNGDLVHAKTNVTEERLGEILYKLGKISDEAHTQMERYIEPNQPIGKAMISKGLTSQRNVEDAVTYQMKEIALSLFAHFDAEIILQEKITLVEQEFSTRISLPYLIEDGIRRMKFDPALQSFLERKIPYLKNRDFFNLLTEEEKEMINKIKGGETSEALWRSLKFNPEFFWKSLYLFYCLNLVDFRDREEIPTEKAKERGTAEVELQQQLEEVLTFKEKLKTSNYYQILGVAKGASEDDIKKAYFNLARKFHPDRFDRSIPSEYRAQIEDLFDNITKAYRTLTSKELRTAYDVKTPAASAQDVGKDLGKRADMKFRQAKTLFSQTRYKEAVILLEEVVALKKTKGDYFLLLAMTEAKIPAFRRKAEGHFLKAIELEPWNPECHVGLGMLYKQEGMMAKATKQFQNALAYDHDHEIACRELDSLTKGKKRGGLKGLFSKSIFGSKKK